MSVEPLGESKIILGANLALNVNISSAGLVSVRG